MNRKIDVGIIGATGVVGQNYIHLLNNHPWFKVTYVAASPRSAGKQYAEAAAGRWLMKGDIPRDIAGLIVGDASDVGAAKRNVSLVFSAVDLDKNEVRTLEEEYAAAGLAVVSNNSAHRHTPDVPMIIPEVNPDHAGIIVDQRRGRRWSTGLLAVKPNCSVQSYMAPLHALRKAGYDIRRVVVTTAQALSGKGYPGHSALDMVDNMLPYIPGEEEKSETEPKKIFGRIENGKIIDDESIRISAHCNRVNVTDGHTACVSLELGGNKPSLEEVKSLFINYSSLPQELKLPSAPVPAIVYREEIDRPQPARDRDTGRGMTVTVGRLRPCNVFDFRFTGLSHNTIRGAAGGAILIAELLYARGYLG